MQNSQGPGALPPSITKYKYWTFEDFVRIKKNVKIYRNALEFAYIFKLSISYRIYAEKVENLKFFEIVENFMKTFWIVFITRKLLKPCGL